MARLMRLLPRLRLSRFKQLATASLRFFFLTRCLSLYRGRRPKEA
jgi:hypothetical protein